MSRPIRALPATPTFSPTAKLTLKPLVHLIEEIGRELTGKPVAPYDLMAAMDAKFRLLGWQGLVGMAVSGLDMAYWDALGQVAGKPVVELLGGSPQPIKAYDSYGVVDPDSRREGAAPLARTGFSRHQDQGRRRRCRQ